MVIDVHRAALQVILTFVGIFMLQGDVLADSWGVAPDGTVWTLHSKRFQYAPTFEFAAVPGACRYVSDVIDDIHGFSAVTSSCPRVDTAPVWPQLPFGYVTVVCRGIGAKGEVLGEAGRRTVVKKRPFAPSRYERRAMPYRLAETRIMENFLSWPQTKHLAATGELDLDSYPLNGYPSKMLASEIVGLCEFAASGIFNDNDAKALLELARKAGDYLISYSVPAGEPLEYFPRTYHERGSEYGRFKGEQNRIHLVYPSKAGLALVTLARVTGEGRYLEAAERIARTYIRLQEADGTWPVQLHAKTRRAYMPNRLMPLEAMLFMEALHDVTGKDEYRACSDRAFAFLENGPLKNWNLEGQFEDGANRLETMHKNLSNFPANMAASYLVKRFPDDPLRIAQAEALCKFVEDQFIDWEPPYEKGRSAIENDGEDDGSWNWFCRPAANWCTPVVMEQYGCYHPVDASSAKTIHTLLDVYAATGKAIYMEKARALADAQTRMIEADGFVNTWSVKGVRRDDHRHHTWLNCTLEVMSALGRMADLESHGEAKRAWHLE